jgi:hypothetical protein
MVCLQTADGGESLEIWRAAANILNKQSQTAEKEWSSSSGVGQMPTTPHHKKKPAYYETLHRVLNFVGSCEQ